MAASRIKLTWSHDGIEPQQFLIYRSDGPMDPDNLPVAIATVTGDKREYIDTGIAENSAYYYRVKAQAASSSRISDEIFALAVPPDPYWSDVRALLYFERDVADETGRTWTAGSASSVVDASPIFGTGSLEVNGLGDGVYTSGPLSDNPSAFTIDFFVRIDSLPGPPNGAGKSHTAFYGQTYNGAAGEFGLVYLDDMSKFLLDLRGGTVNSSFELYSSVISLSTNTRYHIEHSYDGTTHRVFLDGELIISGAVGFGWKHSSQPFRIGQMLIPVYAGNRRGAYATFDSFRITAGVARHTAAFDPPTLPPQAK